MLFKLSNTYGFANAIPTTYSKAFKKNDGWFIEINSIEELRDFYDFLQKEPLKEPNIPGLSKSHIPKLIIGDDSFAEIEIYDWWRE